VEHPDKLPCEVHLPDGRVVVIRETLLSDEAGLLRFFRGLPKADRLFLRNDVTRPEVAHRLVRDTERMILSLVGESGGEIVASATLERSRYGWTAHVAEIRLVIARPFQRMGLAKIMTRFLIHSAPSAGIEKVFVSIPDGRRPLLEGMQRMGFEEEAVLRRHVKDISGRLRDLHLLSNDVSHVWQAVEDLTRDFNPMVDH